MTETPYSPGFATHPKVIEFEAPVSNKYHINIYFNMKGKFVFTYTFENVKN